VFEKRIERHITLRNPSVHKKISERHDFDFEGSKRNPLIT
jgi:hypothetical protein